MKNDPLLLALKTANYADNLKYINADNVELQFDVKTGEANKALGLLVKTGFLTEKLGDGSHMVIKNAKGPDTVDWVFEGYSDDTFGEYAISMDDYDNCANGTPIRYKLELEDGSGLLIVGIYADGHPADPNSQISGDGWAIAISTLDRSKPVDWPISMHPSHNDGTNRAVIRAPRSAKLTCLNREELKDDEA